MIPGVVSVRLIVPSEIAVDCLTDDEKSRADRFHFRKDAIQWTSCRIQLRILLGEMLSLRPKDVPLTLSVFGKPGLAPPHDWLHFNLSHCPGMALIALCVDGPVGVDIEPLSRAGGLLECVNTFCHPLEISHLATHGADRATSLLRIWTAKEAVLKALGTGLSHPPETVEIHFKTTVGSATSSQPLAGISDQRLHKLDHPELAAFGAYVSAPSSVGRIEIH